MTTTDTAKGPIDDGKTFLRQSLETLRAACDTILSGASAEVPVLTGDAETYVNTLLDERAPAFIRPFLDQVLKGVEGGFKGTIDAKAAFFIALFKTDIDSALNHLEQKL